MFRGGNDKMRSTLFIGVRFYPTPKHALKDDIIAFRTA
jgi:hypothetical protein